MIPPKEECDLWNPEERFLWALRNMPDGPMTHPSFLKKWSKHLSEAGFLHVDQLKELANADGFVHVSQLPEQAIEFRVAPRGPNVDYNPAAGWVEKGTPVQKPPTVPDIKQLTAEENAAMIAQYLEAGLIQLPLPQPDTAQELT